MKGRDRCTACRDIPRGVLVVAGSVAWLPTPCRYRRRTERAKQMAFRSDRDPDGAGMVGKWQGSFG